MDPLTRVRFSPTIPLIKMKPETAKGTRDLIPKEALFKDEIISKLKKIFELYGYSPLETPILERYDTLSAKYAGGSEILKETFKLKDQGKRELGLRYDLTVPFARFVGMNPNIKLPFKRYQIGPVFRDGPIKLGRLREFYQCDADVVGTESIMAESELINLASRFFKEINQEITIKVNSIKILKSIMNYLEIEKDKQGKVILTIDKKEKISDGELRKELKTIIKNKADKVLEIINKNNLNYLKTILKDNDGINEIGELLRLTKAQFDVSLARGLSYYTGTIFEVYLRNSNIKSSVAAGGRYDNMIQNFLESNNKYPAVGISFGIDVILESLEKPEKETTTEIYIIPINKQKESFETAEKLRGNGLKVDMDLIGRGISKNLDYANKLRIPYVIFIGEEELKKDKLKLRNMKTGEESLLSLNDILKKVKR